MEGNRFMRTYKDLLFLVFVVVWLTINVTTFILTENNDLLFFINNGFVILFCVLLLFKFNNKKFKNWLEKEWE